MSKQPVSGAKARKGTTGTKMPKKAGAGKINKTNSKTSKVKLGRKGGFSPARFESARKSHFNLK